MFVFVRAVTYSALFVGFLLIYLPAGVLSWSGVVRPSVIAIPQVAAMVFAAAGAALSLWCIYTFASIGKGTPAPFDPPRRLVIRGPYRFVRNPMYCGAGLALASAALFYQSGSLLGYAGLFFLATHLFVLSYEEPTLRRTFGSDYQAYCRHVSRWLPSLRATHHSDAP
jgi:protein-S-isoprenylcysteine O-methyltransferase Ste14